MPNNCLEGRYGVMHHLNKENKCMNCEYQATKPFEKNKVKKKRNIWKKDGCGWPEGEGREFFIENKDFFIHAILYPLEKQKFTLNYEGFDADVAYGEAHYIKYKNFDEGIQKANKIIKKMLNKIITELHDRYNKETNFLIKVRDKIDA